MIVLECFCVIKDYLTVIHSKDVLETHSKGTILNSKSPRNYSHNVPFCSTKIFDQKPNAAKVLEIVVNQVWEYVSWLPIDAEKGGKYMGLIPPPPQFSLNFTLLQVKGKPKNYKTDFTCKTQ